MTAIDAVFDDLERLLLGAPLPRAPEIKLQEALAGVLREASFSFMREVRIGPGDVIDFIVAGASPIGLEVKVDGSLSEVTRQIHRYAQSSAVAGILLVTTRARHRDMPSSFAGKRVRVIHLLGGAL